MTKYPSIQTYHPILERGVLGEEPVFTFDKEENLDIHEKVDGANVRIVLFPTGEYLIGSREEFLHASGDLIHDRALGIVEGVLRFAERAAEENTQKDKLLVVHGEFYGGNVGSGAKTYRGDDRNKTAFAAFDVSVYDSDALETAFGLSLEAIAAAREAGGQQFVRVGDLQSLASSLGIETVPVLVYNSYNNVNMPRTIDETYDWLRRHAHSTKSSLVGEHARPEGVIVRSWDRRKIVKIRFEDYEREIKRRTAMSFRP